MAHALLLDGVSKRYAGHTAVDNLCLEVPPGTIYGILGPNGAGKSSTLRMVMNIIIRDSGTVSLLGADPERDRSVLRRVGYLPEERGLYRKMRVLDVIVFFAELKGLDRRTARTEGDRWLERMGLADWRLAKVETLSKGMQQKVQFITTVVHKPDLLILDEPQSGLDPVNQEVLRDTILAARDEGRTVIFSTHNMEQAEQLCEHVCIIAGGRKVLDGRLRDIRRENLGRRYGVEFDGETPTATAFMSAAGRYGQAERKGEGWEIDLPDAVQPRDYVAALNDLDAPLMRFERVQPSLHEIFVRNVGDAAQPQRRPEVAHV
ncbi:MAG TPA: ATP-binding cassette domain-containing protein [Longimicrobiaceae bacterium]|jgi:ABC-2 type transport system ATP-binding protein|nr:ATP-binding cassette domain-containing protein [Longimicrobiaceae bacterium]